MSNPATNLFLLIVAGAYITTASIAVDDATTAGNVLAGRFATANVSAAVLMFLSVLFTLLKQHYIYDWSKSKYFQSVGLSLFALMYVATAANGASMEKKSPTGVEASPFRKQWMVVNSVIASAVLMFGLYDIYKTAK
jgi:hypothetical protein